MNWLDRCLILSFLSAVSLPVVHSFGGNVLILYAADPAVSALMDRSNRNGGRWWVRKSQGRSLYGRTPSFLSMTHFSAGLRTFVEGEWFESDLAEVEAMGGDPFFLTTDPPVQTDTNRHLNDDENDGGDKWEKHKDTSWSYSREQNMDDLFGDKNVWHTDDHDGDQSFSDQQAELEALGGDPFFLTPNVKEHETGKNSFDDDSWLHATTLESNASFTSLQHLSKVDSLDGKQKAELDTLSGDSFAFTIKRGNFKRTPQLEAQIAELEDIGGDPSFLMVEQDDYLNNSGDIGGAIPSVSSTTATTGSATDGLEPTSGLRGQHSMDHFESTFDDQDSWQWDGTIDENAHMIDDEW